MRPREPEPSTWTHTTSPQRSPQCSSNAAFPTPRPRHRRRRGLVDLPGFTRLTGEQAAHASTWRRGQLRGSVETDGEFANAFTGIVGPGTRRGSDELAAPLPAWTVPHGGQGGLGTYRPDDIAFVAQRAPATLSCGRELRYDLVWAGCWYAVVDSAEAGFELLPDEEAAQGALALELTTALSVAPNPRHPTLGDEGGVTLVIFAGAPEPGKPGAAMQRRISPVVHPQIGPLARLAPERRLRSPSWSTGGSWAPGTRFAPSAAGERFSRGDAIAS
ncbi:hypothetical protein EAH80_05670 [Mycobacterium hodleri]|uniref:Uncharacterized protein n=1 Tax=Mycolicibacterium hodleri TaxID=49897 RepID=A0A502ELY0_9MYCO|nr:hypothetical protein EAH80_05670 [Mycolicibacterium hodleri]